MFLISLPALRHNAQVLRETADAAACRIVLALKGFACWKAFPAISPLLDGCCASGLWEAMLAREHFGKHLLTYSPAYTEDDIRQLCEFTHHLDFNSLPQWFRFRETVMRHPRFRRGELHCGLRVNPQHSTGHTTLYDPCGPGSRLGITADQLAGTDLSGLSGLHFHTLCEQNSDDLESTMEAVDRSFGQLLRSPQFRYLNMGGGHWITKPFYDRGRLVRLVRQAREAYQVEVWLEPGEAAAIHTGVLRATVLDVFEAAGHRLAILDISATAHMPDVLEMPYRPEVYLVENPARPDPDGHAGGRTVLAPPRGDSDGGAVVPPGQPSALPAVTLPGERYHLATNPAAPSSSIHHHPSSLIPQPSALHSHRLGGPTCLAGDVVGDYAFPRPLVPGDILVFDDMTHYTMVKTTTFNGVKHPPIALLHEDGRVEVVREFTYADFRDRLA